MDGAPTPSDSERDGSCGDAARLTWVLVDGRAGDDAQILRIAEALGWPYRKVWAKRSVWQTVAGRVQDAFGAFAPPAAWLPDDGPPDSPWPDLALAAGGRNVSFARRIKRASGGKTRIVFLGAPYARLDDFDLIVTTAQWRLPARPNVVHNLLPLNWPSPEALAAAAARWRPRLEGLPRPWLGVAVGGTSTSFALTVRDARRLAARIEAHAAETGGAALISTSRRTDRAAADALAAALHAPHLLYRWQADDRENPYLGFLALADRFLVTNETASMIADALAARKPVELFQLTQRPVSRFLTQPAIVGVDGPDETQYTGDSSADRFRKWLIESGFWTPARNMPRLARMLEANGLASMGPGEGGAPMVAPADSPGETDLIRTIDGIRGLFQSDPPRSTTAEPVEADDPLAGRSRRS